MEEEKRITLTLQISPDREGLECKKSVSKLLSHYFDTMLGILNYVSAVLIFVICIWIVADVIGRVFLNHPLVGTPEVAANSLAAIAFLQMPFILKEDKHIRSVMLLDRLSMNSKDLLNVLAYLLGLLLFAMAFASSWEPMLTSWRIGEYEGEGALRVPSYPVKTIILIGSALITILYARNIVRVVSKRMNARKREGGL